MLNLGEAIIRLQALLARRDLDGGSRRVLQSALVDLRRLQQDPVGLADTLEGQAQALAEECAAEVLRDVAVVLTRQPGPSGAQFFRHSAPWRRVP